MQSRLFALPVKFNIFFGNFEWVIAPVMVRCALFGTCFDTFIDGIFFFTRLREHDFILNSLPDRQGNAGQRRFAWNARNDLAQCQKSRRFRWNVLHILDDNRPAACPALVSFFFLLADSFANAAILWPMSSFPATVQYSDWCSLWLFAAFASRSTPLAAYRLQARFPHQTGFSAVLTCCPLHVVTCHFYDHAQN